MGYGTMFVIFPLYATTVGFKTDSQDVSEVQTFSVTTRGLTKALH